MSDSIDRQDAIDALKQQAKTMNEWSNRYAEQKKGVLTAVNIVEDLPSAQPEGWVKIPDTGIDDLSDGFHTFQQLYYQRMMLFAAIVKQNKDKAWKSLRHEDGELCFGGGWFIVGIDTPEGSYTYHYENSFYSLFDCEELECAKHWDGHTEKDVTRLLSLSFAQPKTGYWIMTHDYFTGAYESIDYVKCSCCGEDSLEAGDYCPNCGAKMVEPQEREDNE